MLETRIAMDLDALERRIGDDRYAALDRSVESELRLAASLGELAKGLIATKTNGSVRDRTREALAPAEEAVAIRLRLLSRGQVLTARLAGELNDALRSFEQAARHSGRRELATTTIRRACDVYRHVARAHPEVAGPCADGLSKCGVWLGRLDQGAAVAATEEAARIRAALAAANPDLSGKYLASLSTLLRTLMVGRSRKQAIAMYRERYSALTSTSMSIRLRACGIQDLDLTPKSHRALLELGCRTLEQAGRLTQQQVMFKSSGDLSTVEEINWKLALVGLRPLTPGAEPDPPSMPVQIGATFGALSVYCPDRDAIAQVRAAIIAAYAIDDAYPLDRDSYLGAHGENWKIADPQVNAASSLGDDIVLIDQPYGGWVTVMSLNWELTPVAKHPLALRLSQDWPVAAITVTENVAYELCWYEHGAATQYAALGRPAGQAPLDKPLAPLDFKTLADYNADRATETKLRAAFGNTKMFSNLTYLPDSGLRQIGVTTPLAEHGDRALFFRTTP
ncbi:hypothetical protein OHB12_29225 [Nocardia sp. NBC_01730]|uniref:hypothetical protein n=1 Tax=Nocardia sp. NBC_01730 TaxID=2975998 RepID=UPI002E143C7A|nr:hypothetical protein OHB12_29225 [Nocardia sp. NBC_01730]